MANYNPFGKRIEDLTKEDLDILVEREIVEGFYVEYKSEFNKPEKIAKSIASFANTYGGWYFVGVESDKTSNKATKISGFDHTIYKDPVPKIMNPARDLLSHMPLLFYKVVEISSTHSVFVVHISEGNETPYIHTNGVIYRRASDASDPIHENDRYAIDRLVDRGKEAKKNFSEFCQDNRTFSNSESNVAWLNIYFRPQPSGLIDDFAIINPQNLKLLLDTSQKSFPLIEFDTGGGINGNSPFNVAHTSGESVIRFQNHYLW